MPEVKTAALAPAARRVVVATGVAAVAAVALVALRLPTPSPHVLPPEAWAPAVALFTGAFLLLQRAGFVFYWREHRTKSSLDEIPLFIGLLVLPMWALVLSLGASVALNQVLSRRRPEQAAFNVGQHVLSGAAAVAVFVGLVGLGVPPLLAAVAGPVVFPVATHGLLAVLFSRIERVPVRTVLRTRLSTVGATASILLGASVGGAAMVFYLVHPLAALATLPILYFLWRFGELSEWNEQELRVHKRLAALGGAVAGRSELDAIAEQALEACRDLFDCGEASLQLQDPATGEPREWTRASPAGRPGAGGVTSTLARGGGAPLGRISIFPRTGGRAFGEREQHLLEAVASAVSAAVATSGALALAESANRRLARSERRYRDLFESANVFIHVTDARGVVTEANEAELSALGYSRHDVVGRHVTDLYADLDRPAFEASLEHLRARGEISGQERRLRRRDGETIPVLVDVKPQYDEDGGFLHHVTFARDVTPLKRLETDLRRANREQADTIARVENLRRELEEFTLWTTHDMREPLRSVATLAKALAEDVRETPPEEAAEIAHQIHVDAERLKERIKALAAFSRVVQRDEPFRDVSLDRVVREAIAANAHLLSTRGVEVRVRAGTLPVVRAQPGKLELAFEELVENAALYHDGATPIVEIGLDEANGEWVVWVKDDGPGIPTEWHERVFHLFQRGPHAQNIPGAGAGLTIAKRIVEHHGGAIWLESRVGEGTTVSVRLPKAETVDGTRVEVAVRS